MPQSKVCNKWTPEHISYLKMAYLRGSSLKEMATKLNRSISAINKVLSRYNLRTHAKLAIPSSPEDFQKEKKPITPKQKPKIKKDTSVIFPLCLENREWVLFGRVIFWLKSQNISVKKSSLDVYYEVNGIPKNKQQVLFMANLMREQQQLPLFFVKGISN